MKALQENIEKAKMDSIRRQWDDKTGKWYFSIADSVGIIAKSTDPRNYWKVQKNRLKKTHGELVASCNQLKMKAGDGKSYLTDVADRDTILSILKILSKDKVPFFVDWFDTLSHQKKVEVVSIEKHSDYSGDTPKLTYPQVEEDAEEFMLLVDGYREHNILIIKAFVAGIDMKNLSIVATGSNLTITGWRAQQKSPDENYLQQELSWGKFSRTIALPVEIKKEAMEVTQRNGILKIKLPVVNRKFPAARRMRTI